MKRGRIRIGTLLINLTVLVLPLGGIAILRIYESALIRQTESELIAQGALIAASYKSTFERIAAGEWLPPGYGRPLRPRASGQQRWQPRLARLDLAIDPVLEPAAEPAPARAPADPFARSAGVEIEAVLREAQRVTLAGLRVVDSAGIIVASTGQDQGLSLAHWPEAQAALGGAMVSQMRRRKATRRPPPLDSISRGTNLRVYVGIPIVIAERVVGAVLVIRTPANIRQAIYGKRKPLAAGALTLLGIVLLLSLVSGRLITRPLRELVDQARDAAGGSGALRRLSHPGTHEVNELSATIVEMARNLEQRATYIRDFAAHVSHEFKTPLTAIRGATELLGDDPGSPDDRDRERLLEILAQNTAYLERLVHGLLTLAHAQSRPAAGVSCQLATVFERIGKRCRDLPLTLPDPVPDTPVAIAADTLESLCTSLIDNSVRHAGPGTHLDIRADIGASELTLEFHDDGCGVSPGNAQRLFEPFFTTRRADGQAGLGLAVARAVLRAHGGDIDLLPSDQGACFALRIPRHGLAAAPGRADILGRAPEQKTDS